MGTNFYLVPKKNPEVYEKLNILQKQYEQKLQDIVEEYKKAVKKELKVLSENKNLKNIVSYDNKDTFLDNMTMPYLWNYELPELHIGKRSMGWKFLFQTNKHWKNIDELIKFYNKNREHLNIVNEYDEVFDMSMEDFIKEEVQYTYNNPKNTSHIDYCSSYYQFEKPEYFIDKKYGYEFTTHEFS